MLRFYYKYIKYLDTLVNKDKIEIYLKKCVKYSRMDLKKFAKNKNKSMKKGEKDGKCKLPRAIY